MCKQCDSGRWCPTHQIPSWRRTPGVRFTKRRLEVGRFWFAYRGQIRPFWRRRPILVGRTRLYTWGPLAVFVGPKL